MIREYTEKELVGYLLWCLGLLMDDVERIVETHPNRKPLETLTREEFAVENADITMAVVSGQLDDMGIDYQKVKEITHIRPSPAITGYLELCKDQ